MPETNKEEMICKLAESRENIKLLQNMLEKMQSNVEHELKLADDTKQYLDEVLFELTGSDFYKKTEGAKNEKLTAKQG